MQIISTIRRKYPKAWHIAKRTNHAVWHVIGGTLQYAFVPLVLFLGLQTMNSDISFKSLLKIALPGASMIIKEEPKPVNPIPAHLLMNMQMAAKQVEQKTVTQPPV